MKSLKAQTSVYLGLQSERRDLEGLFSIVEDSDDDGLKHLENELRIFSKKVDALEFQKLLGGPADRNSAILSINAGAGGTESCDWVAMLFRMYSRFSENHGYTMPPGTVLFHFGTAGWSTTAVRRSACRSAWSEAWFHDWRGWLDIPQRAGALHPHPRPEHSRLGPAPFLSHALRVNLVNRF